MRRICPSRQVAGDGFIRKLWRDALAWDMPDMSDAPFDLEHIRNVLREATTTGAWSQRGLGLAAGLHRDTIGDIIRGRNENPTASVLASIANAMGKDVSIFGLTAGSSRADPPTEAELEAALLDMLPGMPRGGLDRRARYLAESVGRALRLPPGQPATGADRAPDAPSAGALPPEATT